VARSGFHDAGAKVPADDRGWKSYSRQS